MERRINRRVRGISVSETLNVAARAKALAAAGRKICGFGAGEPDFDTPDHIKEAAAAALRDGQTKYTPIEGLMTLRAAVAEKLRRDNGLDYAPAQVVVSNGAKHSLYNVILALCKDGEEIIIPSPYWLSYPEMVTAAGGKSVFVRTREENGYRMTAAELDAAVTKKTKAVIVNSPSNPTGVMYTRRDLEALAEVIVRRRLTVISDEVYEKMTYDGEAHASIGSLGREILDLTVTVNGFSKAYAMTGWRLGYCAGPAWLMPAVCALQSHSTSGPNTFAQHGALAALNGPQECVARMVAAFSERRDVMYRRLMSIPGVTCVKPMGAFYMFPGVARTGLDSASFVARLLEEQGVAVVPGKPFGADDHVRFSYACGMENIREGLDRFEAFVRSL